METDSNYYVYAYFDPRNYEMLYVGKGKGSRKNAHLPNKAGSAKERQLHEIERAGLEPLIRVVAASLTEDQALLVEKALLWRVGGSLTNVSGGHFADKFRPPNTLHLSLPGFDSARGIYFVNVGDWAHRLWEDCSKFGFLAAGYGRKYSSQLDRLEVGSIAAAYLSGSGYVGIARVTEKAVPARDFRFHGRPLRPRMLSGPDLLHDSEDDDECEYLVAVKWIKRVPRDDARFRRRVGLFTPRRIVASLSEEVKTLQYLEQQFKVSFRRLLAAE
ncbi:MAG TPA: GIY-YIG nuclease family protein [Candidatus Paceibacterota bacterium]|nr:GIY-YIG nuclease family protein [Candidatus Paceibacterota bacterium]